MAKLEQYEKQLTDLHKKYGKALEEIEKLHKDLHLQKEVNIKIMAENKRLKGE